MGKRILTVLLIEDNPQYAHLVQHWLSSAADGIEFQLNWTDSKARAQALLLREFGDWVRAEKAKAFLGTEDTAPNTLTTATTKATPLTAATATAAAPKEFRTRQRDSEVTRLCVQGLFESSPGSLPSAARSVSFS